MSLGCPPREDLRGVFSRPLGLQLGNHRSWIKAGTSEEMGSVSQAGAVRLVPRGQVYKQIFEAQVQLVRSLAKLGRKPRFPGRCFTLPRDVENSTDTRQSSHSQEKHLQGTHHNNATEMPLLHRRATTINESWKNGYVNEVEEVRGLPNVVVPEESRRNISRLLGERRRHRHDKALDSMYHELDCITKDMEPLILAPGKVLMEKLMESDVKFEQLFKTMELDAAQEGCLFKKLEELWNIIQEESLSRNNWIKEMDESLREVVKNQADKVTDVLRKYTVKLEEVSYLLSDDIYRLIDDEAMTINRALLVNQRTIAHLFFNVMTMEAKRRLSHQLKWQNIVKDWKLFQKSYVVQRFREFIEDEERISPPAMETEIEHLIKDQALLSERRLELLKHLGDLLPPAHTKDEINYWYLSLVNLNEIIDTHNMQCVHRIQEQYETVQKKNWAEVQLCKNKLLNLYAFTTEEVEEIVNSELIDFTENLQRYFEEKLECMNRDFEELAKQNEQNCAHLYSYFQEVVDLWDAHQLRLSQQESELLKKLEECSWEYDKGIKKMEAKMDRMLQKMTTANSAVCLKKSLNTILSSLDDINAWCEKVRESLNNCIMTYPEAVLEELISYSTSISHYFDVKEIFKQNLQGETELTFQDRDLVKTPESECLEKQQVESIVQESEGEGMTDSYQQENQDTSTAESEESFKQETEETEDGESESKETIHEEQEGSITQEEKQKALKTAMETFSTSSGNTYTVLGVEEAGKADSPGTYFTEYENSNSLPTYLNNVLIKESEMIELKKWIRLCTFEHLEKWFAETLSNTFNFVAAKNEEVNSALGQLLSFYQQRAEDIKTNVYNTRDVELLAHKESLESHCAGLAKDLKKQKEEFKTFCDQQNDMIQKLQSRVYDIETALLNAPLTKSSVSFMNSVDSELQNELKKITVFQSNYKNDLEEALRKLRQSNEDFLKNCRSFSEGGNFSSEEIKSFTKQIQKENRHIATFEKKIKADVKKMELSCLEQATEFIEQSEKKLNYIVKHRVFMKQIRRFLSNLQMKIRSEIERSKLQTTSLNSYLEKLQNIDACIHPTADKKALTSEELYKFIKMVLTEVKKRSQYLDCLLLKATCDNKELTPLAKDVTSQGPVPVASQKESDSNDNRLSLAVVGMDPEKFPLLKPSRKGKSALRDVCITVIQNLLQFQPSSKVSGPNQNNTGGSQPLKAGPQKPSFHNSLPYKVSKSPVRRKVPKGRKASHSKTDITDKKFQIFGEKPPETDTFKMIVANILWKGNNNLLSLAQDFYENQYPRNIMPEDVPETFEAFAKMLKRSLLSYQNQADVYYRACLTEFQEQLKQFQKELPHVAHLAVNCLLNEHQQKLLCSTTKILQNFKTQMKVWEDMKAIHKNQLCPSLGHPDNSLQMETLCQEEIKRQSDQCDGINLYIQNLQECTTECAQNFISVLAAFTKKLLLELDEMVTTDDIQVPKTEKPKEKISTLIRHKQAELPLEVEDKQPAADQGSRTWPGIPKTILSCDSGRVFSRETASVTTSKSTLSHTAAVEARNAAYEKYQCNLEQLFALIKEEEKTHLLHVQRWEKWWKHSIQKIKQLYT